MFPNIETWAFFLWLAISDSSTLLVLNNCKYTVMDGKSYVDKPKPALMSLETLNFLVANDNSITLILLSTESAEESKMRLHIPNRRKNRILTS
jgi:hypothetical protein